MTALGSSPLTLRALPALPEAVSHAVELLRAVHRTSPPAMPAPDDAGAAALHALGARIEGLGARQMHEVLRLLFMSARDFFEEQIGSEPVRALLAGASVRALSEGPFAQGTLFGFLHRVAVDDAPLPRARRGAGSARSSLRSPPRRGRRAPRCAPAPLPRCGSWSEAASRAAFASATAA